MGGGVGGQSARGMGGMVMGAEVTPPTRRAMIKTGAYTGDGSDNRNIDIGINLLSKVRAFVFTKTSTGGEPALWRSDVHTGDVSSYFAGATDDLDMIQALTSTGFQIGASGNVNFNGRVYRHVAIWEEP